MLEMSEEEAARIAAALRGVLCARCGKHGAAHMFLEQSTTDGRWLKCKDVPGFYEPQAPGSE